MKRHRSKSSAGTLKKRAKPGTFSYYGGMVFEVDNCGRRRPRKDIGPKSGKFKHKFYRPGKSCAG